MISLYLCFFYERCIFRFTSENYQVMNYGVGGYISEHFDEYDLPDTLALCLGGGRKTFFMKNNNHFWCFPLF